MILLIHPPVVKPSEPPPGIAKLVGALNQHDIENDVLDANREGLLYLLASSPTADDTWSRRALRHKETNLTALRTAKTYNNSDRYKRCVLDLNRLLQIAADPYNVRLSFADYYDRNRSPVKSHDLVRAAEIPEENLFYPYFQPRLTGLLGKRQVSTVGFSLNYLSQALCTFAMVGFLRREYSNIAIVLGGGLITSWMSRPDWKNPFAGLVDHLIAGPGETALPALMGAHKSCSRRARPDYSRFVSSGYIAPGPILPYSASTGCYWNSCSFCPERAEGNRFVSLPVGDVIEDIHCVQDQIKPVLLHLVDNAISPALLRGLTERPPGVPWYGFVRISSQLTDPDFCAALKRSGCVMLKLGLESGDQGVLDELHKGIVLEHATTALRILKHVEITTYVYLLFGTPPETEQAAQKTLDFVAAHSDSIDFLNVAIFNLPLYGPEAELLDLRTFYEGDLSLYADFVHPHGWNRKIVRSFLDKEFRRHAAIAPIIRRDPPLFTSNHAAFFV